MKTGAVAAMSDILVASVVCPASNIKILYAENPSTPAGKSHFRLLHTNAQCFFSAVRPKGAIHRNVNSQRQNASSTGDKLSGNTLTSGKTVLHSTVASKASQ